MQYQKNQSVSGNWIKGKDVVSGTRAKLVSEAIPTKSQFKDKNGNDKTQDVAKIRFENDQNVYNISLNRASLEGLIDAFGEDSKSWVNKYLTAHTEKVVVGGKRVVALYLVPEGFVLEEDSDGYMHIVNPKVQPMSAPEPKKGEIDTIEYPDGEANPDLIPF